MHSAFPVNRLLHDDPLMIMHVVCLILFYIDMEIGTAKFYDSRLRKHGLIHSTHVKVLV